jgi:hypothetical protein
LFIAVAFQSNATEFSCINLRVPATQSCHAVNNRRHFALSDVRKLITQAAPNQDFVSFCSKSDKPRRNVIIEYGCLSESLDQNGETSVIKLARVIIAVDNLFP